MICTAILRRDIRGCSTEQVNGLVCSLREIEAKTTLCVRIIAIARAVAAQRKAAAI